MELNSHKATPQAPILDALVKEKGASLDDPQFWISCISRNWKPGEAEALGEELRALLGTDSLLMFLNPVFCIFLENRDLDLLKFLLKVEPKTAIDPIGQFCLLTNAAVEQNSAELDLLLPVAASQGKIPSEKGILEFLSKENHDALLEKFLDHHLDSHGKVSQDPFRFCQSWYQYASEALNLKVAQYVCKKIKEELIKYPVYRYLLTEKELPDLSLFHLSAEKEKSLLDELKALLKKEPELKPRKLLTSKDRGTQMRLRHAQYSISGGKGAPKSFFMSYVNARLYSERFRFRLLFDANPELSYKLDNLSISFSKEEIAKALEELQNSNVTLALTATHGMLLFREENDYYFFDPNYGILNFSERKIFESYVSEWLSKYVSQDNAWPFINEFIHSHHEQVKYLKAFIQFEDLVGKGICANFALDLAQQLLLGMKKGKKITHMLNEETLGYRDFSGPNHLQKEMENLLETSQFAKAINVWEGQRNWSNIRTYLAYLIASANGLLQSGKTEEAIREFKEAEAVLESIPLLEGMPEGTAGEKKQRLLEERKKQIKKGLELAQKLEHRDKKMQSKDAFSQSNTEPEPSSPLLVFLVPVSLKEKDQ